VGSRKKLKKADKTKGRGGGHQNIFARRGPHVKKREKEALLRRVKKTGVGEGTGLFSDK